jgi:hypothetical protein
LFDNIRYLCIFSFVLCKKGLFLLFLCIFVGFFFFFFVAIDSFFFYFFFGVCVAVVQLFNKKALIDDVEVCFFLFSCYIFFFSFVLLALV